VSRNEIQRELDSVFATVAVSDRLPYWHFVCARDSPQA
jgi:hypothetical protein